MASNGNVSKLKINNSEYDIKDDVSRGLIGTESGSAIGTAVGDNTKTDIVAALAKLKADITSAGGAAVTNVEWDATNKKLTKTKSGSTTDVVTAAQLVTGLRDTVTSSTAASKQTSTAGFATPSDVTALITYARMNSTFSVVTYDPGNNQSQGWVDGEAGVIYLYQRESQDTDSNIYEEWLWDSANGRYEIIGTTEADLDDYARKDGAIYSGTHNFTGATVTVAAPTADSNAATKKYVDDLIANDKIQDYQLISVTSAVTYGNTIDIATSYLADIKQAYENNKIPILRVTLSEYNDTVYVPIIKNTSLYSGSAATIVNDAPVNVIVVYQDQTSGLHKIGLSKAPITSVTPTTGTVNAMTASYASEVITFTSSTPTVVTAVTAS